MSEGRMNDAPMSDDEFLDLFGAPTDEGDAYFPPGNIGDVPVPAYPDSRERWFTVEDPALQRKLDDAQANEMAALDAYYREYAHNLEALLLEEQRNPQQPIPHTPPRSTAKRARRR